jgi:ParB family chromosome partitioning protein
VAEKLDREAGSIRAEGWKWVEVAPEFPYGHTYGLRRLLGEEVPLTDEEQATQSALAEEYEALEKRLPGGTEAPEEVEQRFGEIEAALNALADRPIRFDPAEAARAGVFVSIDGSGWLRIERGYVRPEDEPPEPEQGDDAENSAPGSIAAEIEHGADRVEVEPGALPEPEEEEGIRPIPDRLMTELTAHRTLALRHALGEQPDIAFLAALHALCLKAFYRYAVDSCAELDLRSVVFGAQARGLNDTELAQSFDRRHQTWLATLPKEPEALWDALMAFDGDSQQALFAHCVALSINGMFEPYNRRPRAFAHADRLAEALGLDMVAAGWVPTVDNFLGRVTKARILGAVREARGDRAAELMQHLKKGEMAEKAEALLAGSGWLAEPLRTPGRPIGPTEHAPAVGAEATIAESAAAGQETVLAASTASPEDAATAAGLDMAAAE